MSICSNRYCLTRCRRSYLRPKDSNMSLRSAEKALYACFGHIRHNLARDSNWSLAFEDTISHFD